MSATIVRDVSTAKWPAAPARTGAWISFLYLAITYSLTIIAFVEPIEYAWYRSVYDESDDDQRSEVSAREGYLQRQIALGAMGLLGAAALAWPSDRRLRLPRALGVLCVAFVAWCVATCFWSDDISISVRRIVAQLCEVLAGLAIAKRAGPRQFVWFVFACTITWFGLGLAAELSLGALQPWQAGYRFKGIFHPNIMSVVCALLIMSSLYLSKGKQPAKRVLQGIAGSAFVFLLLTGSRTALGALLMSLAIVWAFTGSRSRKFLFIGCAVLAIGSFTIASGLDLLNVSSDWIAMGRQDNEVESLSSRVPLWQELVNVYVSQRPLGGYGYGAFWSPTRIFDVARSQGWSPAYAHSSYVDLTLNIGIVGTVLFLMTMILAFLTAVRLETRQAKAGFGFAAMVIAFVLLDGAMETTFGNTWFTSFFAITAVCLLLMNVEAEPQRGCAEPANSGADGFLGGKEKGFASDSISPRRRRTAVS